MENNTDKGNVYSSNSIRRKESSGEGSADLEKLLQTAETENLEMLKLIETERQKSTEFKKQIEEIIPKTEHFENSTQNLDVEAKQLHNKFKQNREICEGLKKTSLVLDEHEEALCKKLEMITLEHQTELLQNQEVVEKYENIWASYAKKYQDIPLAKELSKIKQTVLNTKTSVQKTSEQITKLQTKIIEMEVEKARMKEFLQRRPEKAKEGIVKIAGLYLKVQNSTAKAREKLQQLKAIGKKTEGSGVQGENMELANNEKEISGMMNSNEANEAMPPAQTVNRDESEAEEAIACIPNEKEMVIARQENATFGARISTRSAPSRVVPITEQSPQSMAAVQTLHQRSREVTSLRNKQKSRQRKRLGQRKTVEYHVRACNPRQTFMQRTPSSNQRNRENDQCSYTYMRGRNASVKSTDVVGPLSFIPNTPKDNATRTTQSAASTAVHQTAVRSPLDLEKHRQYLKEIMKSPSEGFKYTRRPMYNVSQVNQQQAQKAATREKERSGVTYEEPLNDQCSMSLNFFKPLHQEQEEQNLFQSNPEQPTSTSSRSIFMESTASSSGSGEDFLTSNSSHQSIFGEKNQESGSLDQGFSLFGSSSSPNETSDDVPDSFNFSFGGGDKSPENNSKSPSGFFLF